MSISSGSVSTSHLPAGLFPSFINLQDLCPTKGQDESLLGVKVYILAPTSSPARPVIQSEQHQDRALSIEKVEGRLSGHSDVESAAEKSQPQKLRNGSHVVKSGPQ